MSKRQADVIKAYFTIKSYGPNCYEEKTVYIFFLILLNYVIAPTNTNNFNVK